jgi:riboflavin kinase / FMN adenylyltransferase
MEVIHLESPTPLDSDTILGLGFFDGIHRGHQKIIERVCRIAREKGIAGGLLTFRRHSIEVLHPYICFPYITTMEEKIHIAGVLGLDYLVDVEFTREFSLISPEAFVEDILLKRTRGKGFVVGRDYRFGFRAMGDAELLRQIASGHGLDMEIVDYISSHNMKIGSSLIRELIMGGDIELANDNLGRWYSISGPVVGGKKRGRRLGIPTANIMLPADKVIPRPGVYCVMVLVDGVMYQGVANLGDRPTFDEEQFNTEVHLFDFSGNLYGKNLRVFYLKNLREIIKFPDEGKMVTQIHSDICECQQYFKDIAQEEIRKNMLFSPPSPQLSSTQQMQEYPIYRD